LNLSTSVNRISSHDLETASDERMRLLNELHNLLEKLLQLAQQGNSTNEKFGVLTSKASSLVKEIERTGILDRDELQHRREKLRKRYENLCLIIAAEKANACRELSQVRRGKKVVETYRGNKRL